jgi:hydrogenase maturation protein HypF
VMAEHGLAGDSPVIGIAFDGTGYGTDGAIWGGEVLLADYKGFTRAAHLAYVPLAGGDASVRRPYRMALAHLRAAGEAWASDLPPVLACSDTERRVLLHQLGTGLGCTPTSSMGRLFDAVSSLAGVRHVADYEAQAAIELEGISRNQDDCGAYPFALQGAGPVVADAAPVVRAVVADVREGVPAAIIGARFHAGVATLVVDLAARCRTATDLGTVALSGGVFGNALLLSMTRKRLRDRDFTVLCHRHVPPNDGGLALGQVLVASAG